MAAAPSSVVIRPGQPSDAPAVARLADALRRHLGDPTGALTAEVILRDGFSATPSFSLLVAEIEAAVVGYALYHPCYEPAFAARGYYLADLAVDASVRRRGVGRALLTRLTDVAAADGRTYVFWMSQPANDTAQRFYDAVGTDRVAATLVRVKLVGAAGTVSAP